MRILLHTDGVQNRDYAVRSLHEPMPVTDLDRRALRLLIVPRRPRTIQRILKDRRRLLFSTESQKKRFLIPVGCGESRV